MEQCCGKSSLATMAMMDSLKEDWGAAEITQYLLLSTRQASMRNEAEMMALGRQEGKCVH